MGLDNIVYETKAVANKELAEALRPLTGGMMVDDANSFRGKVYNDLNEAICGHSLYHTDEWTYNSYKEIVHDYEQLIEEGVNEWLEGYNKSADNVWGKDYREDEILALYKVFKLCLDNDWKINAWF